MEAVRWTVAERFAELADRAADAEDERALASALSSLDAQLDKLAPAVAVPGGGNGGGDPRSRVVGILDRAAVVDAADAG